MNEQSNVVISQQMISEFEPEVVTFKQTPVSIQFHLPADSRQRGKEQ